MKFEILTIPSFWKTDMKQKYYQLYEENNKLVVLFPGKNYPCDKPCLHFAGTSSIQSGFDLLVLEYGYQAARTDLDMNELQRVIEDSYESVQRIISKYNQVVFISKSIGTIVAGEVHEQLEIPVKHLFLTPIKDTIHYVNKFNGLVVYGTKDEVFNHVLANQINIDKAREVIEIPNASHSLEAPSVEESIEILSKLVKIYVNFLNK
ncbi:putative alpha/beta-hydrolase family hydrolase [Paenibacillus sp. LBL]|uniref:alpha/beta hydrolase n=1 Tax=Paenibacillus sp. LBL TaxID=2940563 RepID=UPI00247453AF|nr:alpha/beta hydrolase [Paenibacillus sp. LBL]MDH6669828.1 putative alpha/beta-hydrolase family hydrolase [Paenibacillus sp. LBL]